MADAHPGLNEPEPLPNTTDSAALPVQISVADVELHRLFVDVSKDKGVILQDTMVQVTQIIKYALTIEGVRVDLSVLKEGVRLAISRQNPAWVPIAGVCFTVLTLASLYPLVTGWAPAATKNIFFNVWVAFCVAASASFLGGSATASGALPLPSQWGQNPVKFVVFGGVGIFIVVLIFMSLLNT
jgi:hypothetical protein